MNIFETTIIISLAILVLSCKQKNHNYPVSEISFKKQVDISYKEINIDFYLSYPKSLLLTDSFIVIQDDRGHDYFYHVLNRNTGQLEFEFAKKGNGPNEVLSTSINPMVDQQENSFQFFDRDRRNINNYNLFTNIMSYESVGNKVADYGLWAHNFFTVGNYYLSLGMNGKFEYKPLAIFDKSLKLTGMFGEYPFFSSDEKKNKELLELYRHIYFFRISNDKRKAIFASYTMGLFQIFDLTELPHKVTTVKSIQLTPLFTSNENIWGFEDVYVSNNYAYLLHNGQASTANQYYSTSIKVFDWEGTPIADYNTEVSMRCIAIDEDEEVIFAIAYTDEKGFFLIKMKGLTHL